MAATGRRLGSDLFTLPPFEEDDTRRSSAVLRATLITHIIAVIVSAVVTGIVSVPYDASGIVNLAIYITLLGAAVVAAARGRLRVAGAIAVSTMLFFSLLGVALGLGVTSAANAFCALLLAAQTFGARGAIIVTLVTFVGVFSSLAADGRLASASLDTSALQARIIGAFVIQLASIAAFVIMSARSTLSMLQRLRSEQAAQRDLNVDLARRVADEETLVKIGRMLVEGDEIHDVLDPALSAFREAWGLPVVLFGRGEERPMPLAHQGMKAPVLIGGHEEAARIVSLDEVAEVTVVDGAHSYSARAMGVRTGTVPHGLLVATVDDSVRAPTAVDALLRGAAALLAAAFEWREATGRLRVAEKRRAALVKSSPDAFLIVDEHASIIDANATAARLLLGDGGSELLIGTSLAQLEVLSADDLKRITRALGDSVRGKPSEELAMTLHHDNRTAHVELRVLYSVDGGRGRFDVAMRDVTARVEADRQRERLEGQLFAARRLEALGQLAGGVAHDFNNLLSVILTNARLLVEHDALDQQAKEDLSEIVDCGRRAADLTGQLLTFARQQRRTPRVLRINNVVTGVEKLLRRLIPADIKLVFQLDFDVWPVVADPAQLEQVLVNLVANARDAMEGGGTCTVTTKNITGTAIELGIEGGFGDELGPLRYVEMVVADTGSGMDEETIAHVFEPFFTTKPLGRGSGLGLATVYGIVKQSGGNISVDSARGQGSRFRVLLPYATDPEGDERTPAVGDSLARGSERVLVVDDDDAVRRATERALVSRGFAVLVARGSTEALELSHERFDAVIADLVMPDMAGDTLVEKLREQRRDLPCVLLTGYGRRSVELSRPFRLLRKPASPEELARSVRAVIDESTVTRGS